VIIWCIGSILFNNLFRKTGMGRRGKTCREEKKSEIWHLEISNIHRAKKCFLPHTLDSKLFVTRGGWAGYLSHFSLTCTSSHNKNEILLKCPIIINIGCRLLFALHTVIQLCTLVQSGNSPVSQCPFLWWQALPAAN
jgi:hypothetical protein